jgi:hypothetical protein
MEEDDNIEFLKTQIRMLRERLKSNENLNKEQKKRFKKILNKNIIELYELNKNNEKSPNMNNKTQRVNIDHTHNKIKLISPSEKRFKKKISILEEKILHLERDINLNEIMIMNSKQKHNKTEEEIDKEKHITQEITMFKDKLKEESKKLKDLIDELEEKQHKKEIHEIMSDMLIKSLGTLSITNIDDNNSNSLQKNTLKSILKNNGGRKSNKTRKNKTRRKK